MKKSKKRRWMVISSYCCDPKLCFAFALLLAAGSHVVVGNSNYSPQLDVYSSSSTSNIQDPRFVEEELRQATTPTLTVIANSVSDKQKQSQSQNQKEDHHSPNSTITITITPTTITPKPNNLRIVLIGDSTTRYMYLSLVYYLKHRDWPPRGHKLLEKVKDSDPNGWNDWLHYTHEELQPYELSCDCYRHWTTPFKWYRHVENRYFRQTTTTTTTTITGDIGNNNNNHISFLTKMGDHPFHGHWNASTIFQEPHEFNTTQHPYTWYYPSWKELIDDHISRLQPKPDYFVFNQGHWKKHELKSHAVLQEIQDALRRANIQGIYRTTTFRSDEMDYATFRNAPTRKHDARVCQYFPCLNVSWTALTPPEDYVDTVHFTAPVNNQMTQQLLDMIEKNDF